MTDQDRASQWLEATEKVLEVPGKPGLEIRIVQPDAWTWQQCGLPAIVFDIGQPDHIRAARMKEAIDAVKGSTEKMVTFMTGVLKACMVDPQLWTGPKAEMPKGHVTLQHLGGYAEIAFLECIEMLDLEALKGVAAKAAQFRSQPSGDTGESGGPAVQDSTQPAAEGAKP